MLIPFTASLGVVLYFPIILNIFVLTVSIDFAGTPFITGLMLLGNLYLLCWDYDRWRGILPSWQRTRRMFDLRGYLLWGGLFGLCAIFGATGLAYLNVAMLRQDFVPLLISAIVCGVGFGIAVHWHAQRLVKQ